jgi:hypothetical protein
MRRNTIVLLVLLAGGCAAMTSKAIPVETTSTTHSSAELPVTTRAATPASTEAASPIRQFVDAPTATGVIVPAGMPTSIASVTPDLDLFPIGFMWVNVEHLGQIAVGGFNVAHRFAGAWDIAEAEGYLSQADAVGLEVIMDLLECRAYETDKPYCEGLSTWNEQEWGEYILTLSTHDNLAAWFLPDEIDDYGVAANLYKWVHTYDPLDRPVFANPGSWDQSTIALFPAFSDFIWTAAYPEYGGGPRAIVTYAMRLDANACRGTDKRWGGILQFFDSAEFGRSGGYPTAHELRCDSYQAIIGGATGLWYFTYEHGKDLDGLMAEMEKIANEIIGTGGLDEVILSPNVPQTITKTILSGPTQSPIAQGEVYDSIQALQKEHQGTYLFVVNIATDTVVVEFGNLPTGTEQVEVLFEGRTIPVSDDTFRDTFLEAGVHIYHTLSDVVFLPLITKSSPS